MKIDIQMFTKCCFCLPLRRGLLAWGYVKMILLLLFMALIMTDIQIHPDPEVGDTLAMGLFLLTGIESLFNIVLIVGAHMKSANLFVFYYLYISMQAGFLFIWMTSWLLMKLISNNMNNVLYDFMYMISLFFLDVYIAVLVNTEIKKLDKDTETPWDKNKVGIPV